MTSKRDDKADEANEPAGETPAWLKRDPLGTGGNADAPQPGKSATTAADPADSPAAVADAGAASAPPAPPSPRRTTAETWMGRSKPARKFFGLPLWGWLLVVAIAVSVLFIFFDLRNRSRFRLVCRADHLELQQGRRLPWPFGHETVGGRFKPVAIPPDADCQNQLSRSRTEAESAFLDLILSEARRAQQNTETTDLKKMRALVLQALRITRANPHRARRREAERALADIAYRQGRAGLARVEHELRTALGHLQEAQKRAGDRYEDLAEWIEHLESLLRSVAPAPGGGPRVPFSSPQRPLDQTPPLPPAPPRPSDVTPPSVPPPDAVEQGPDAGPSSSDPASGAGGIVM